MDAQPSGSWFSKNRHRRRGTHTPMPPASCPLSPPREPLLGSLPGSKPPSERTRGPRSHIQWANASGEEVDG